MPPPATAIANGAHDTLAAKGLKIVMEVPSRISKMRKLRTTRLLALLARLSQLS